jgi:hypothetical protein
MIIVNCFIEPVCNYSGEHDKFVIPAYLGTIAYKDKSFCAEMKLEKDLPGHFKQLLHEQYNLLPENITFSFVESPEDL